eukprot:10345887-Prorocentrum_lima.AAC.1
MDHGSTCKTRTVPNNQTHTTTPQSPSDSTPTSHATTPLATYVPNIPRAIRRSIPWGTTHSLATMDRTANTGTTKSRRHWEGG